MNAQTSMHMCTVIPEHPKVIFPHKSGATLREIIAICPTKLDTLEFAVVGMLIFKLKIAIFSEMNSFWQKLLHNPLFTRNPKRVLGKQ